MANDKNSFRNLPSVSRNPNWSYGNSKKGSPNTIDGSPYVDIKDGSSIISRKDYNIEKYGELSSNTRHFNYLGVTLITTFTTIILFIIMYRILNNKPPIFFRDILNMLSGEQWYNKIQIPMVPQSFVDTISILPNMGLNNLFKVLFRWLVVPINFTSFILNGLIGALGFIYELLKLLLAF